MGSASSQLLTKCAPVRRRFHCPRPQPRRFLTTQGTPVIGSRLEEICGAAADRFELSPSSVLNLHKGDITVWSVDRSTDAIVSAASEIMLGVGGVEAAIHRAAGPEFRDACSQVPEVRPGVRCPTGEARITPAFCLPVPHVIHTVGPIYGVHPQPEASLRKANRNSLRLAKENSIQYIAFPAISCAILMMKPPELLYLQSRSS